MLIEDVFFHWMDYLMLVLTLLLSCAVGIYYGIAERNKSTADDYLMAGRSMPVWPVSFSLFVSFLSSISFLGDPVEVYYYGAIYWSMTLGFLIGLPIIAHVFAPILYRMKLISVCEYLEIRYNSKVRIICSIISGIGMMLFMGVVLYAPSLALSQVSGLDVWLCIMVVGVVCTFYTSLGGMKAVLWADTMQFFLMMAGLLAIFIQGILKLGGISNIWNISKQGGRLNFFEFNPSPFYRSTFWTFVIGGVFRALNPHVSGQVWVQRYCSLKSERDVKLAIYLNLPLYLIFLTLFTGNGLVLYAYYNGCDPLQQGRVRKPDQMIPLLVLELFQQLPGVSGLFLGSLVSASLSTLSSGQSGLAAACLSDVVHPLYHRLSVKKRMSEKCSTILAKVLSASFGVLNIFISFLMMFAKDSNVFQLSLSLVNATFAPVAGVYIVGILFPFINTMTALTGSTVSFIVSCWITMGTLLTGVRERPLPVTMDRCTNQNLTLYVNDSTILVNNDNLSFTTMNFDNHRSALNGIYNFSPLLYPALGPIINIVCSLLIWMITVSFLKVRKYYDSNPNKDEKIEQVANDEDYPGIFPFAPTGEIRTTTI